MNLHQSTLYIHKTTLNTLYFSEIQPLQEYQNQPQSSLYQFCFAHSNVSLLKIEYLIDK